MISIENRNYLRLKHRDVLDRLTTIENSESTGKVVIEQAKSGVLTLKTVIGEKSRYIHSKYDPEKEAKLLVDKFEYEEVKHVLFIGTGLGYHIKSFINSHPNTDFSLYEPDEEVLYSYFSNTKLENLPVKNLKRLVTGIDSNTIINEVRALLQMTNGMIHIIILPVYEKMYTNQIDLIRKEVIEALKNKRTSLVVNLSFQKRWTINSIKNFPTVLQTPNILHDVDKEMFDGKPAIIVAAGPSLNEELENLRYIKENGLAYIFSVGSAINSLIEHGIYPDATCAYDPSEEQYVVTKKVVDEDIHDIPLIYGTSVGYETLERYPGKMLHMITSQDTVSPQLLDTTKDIDIVFDAPSIAVIAFQLLLKLKANPIILVGQNLGYQDNKRYASGINYDFVENEVSNKEIEDSYTVKDVYGHTMQTSEGFNLMRAQLEMYASKNSNIEVINTTRGGAQIGGTSFQHLDELITGRLKSKVVDDKWLDQCNSYDIEFTRRKLARLSTSEKDCTTILRNALEELKRIHMAFENKQTKNMESHFVSFDKEFNKLKKNLFYIGFLEPMVRVQNKQLSENNLTIRYETDILKKADIVVRSFESFIRAVQLHHDFTKPLFKEMKTKVERL